MTKKTLTALAAAATLGLFAANAQAAPETDLLTLSGEVDYNCEGGFSGTDTATLNLAFDTGTQRPPQPLADVVITCNDADGFNVSFSSANSGQIEDSSGAYWLSYTLSGTGSLLNSSITFGTTYSDGFSTDAAQGNHITDVSIDLQDGKVVPGGVVLTDEITITVDGA
jgi:hypothetical protein